MESPPSLESHEKVQSGKITLATSAYHKDWYPGKLQDPKDSDKIRGDLTLETIRKTKSIGIDVMLVDGGSSEEFRSELAKLDVTPHEEAEHGLSASRRQAYRLASESGSDYIFTTEPEKVSIIDSLPKLVKPLASDEADIVIPKRTESSFDSYPPVQAEFEKKSNKLANAMIRSRGLLSPQDPDIDFWVGVRLFKNKTEILKIFTEKYDMNKPKTRLGEKLDMEKWQNALYIPIIIALANGFRVKSVEVPYEHPETQTMNEVGEETYDEKRAEQYRTIIYAIAEAIKLTESQSGKSQRPTRLKSG